MNAPQIQFARTTDNVNIAYCTMGSGQPLVYASNVWGDIHWYLHNEPTRREVDRLASSGWRIVRYDGRGFGASDHDVAELSLEAKLADLEAVVEAASVDRFALCGYGHGGPVTIAYAVSHPERVSHLILVNSFALGSSYYQKLPTMQALVAMRSMAEDRWEFVTQTIATAALGFNDPVLARKTAELYRSSTSAKTFFAFVEASEKVDVRDMLGRVGVPTLVVLDGSGFATEDLPRVLASGVPNARFVTTSDYTQELHSFVRGEPLPTIGAAGVPASIIAILFTDLVGHTEMMARLGDDAGRDVLREHESITREVLKAHGGTEVKTMGDGFMASFGSVTKAVECAIALQRAFAEREGEPLKVRVGLNAGEPIEEDGDLFGATVILASRIAAKAGGGEILVADTVRGLCSGKGFLFADRGEFVAKGFEEPVRVYEVGWQNA